MEAKFVYTCLLIIAFTKSGISVLPKDEQDVEIKGFIHVVQSTSSAFAMFISWNDFYSSGLTNIHKGALKWLCVESPSRS